VFENHKNYPGSKIRIGKNKQFIIREFEFNGHWESSRAFDPSEKLDRSRYLSFFHCLRNACHKRLHNIVNRRQNQRSARACAPIRHDQLIANQLIEKYCAHDNQRIFNVRPHRRPIVHGALRSPLNYKTYWSTSQRAQKSVRYTGWSRTNVCL